MQSLKKNKKTIIRYVGFVFICLIIHRFSFGRSGQAHSDNRLLVPDEYQTIQAAIYEAQSGQTVYIKAGIYSEPIHFKEGIQLIGEGMEKVFIRHNSITVDSCRSGLIKDLTVEDITEKEDKTHPDGIIVSNSSVEISHCRVRRIEGSGIKVKNDSQPFIHHCVCESNKFNGLRSIGKDTLPTIENSTFTSNGYYGVVLGKNSGGTAEDNLCEKNTYYGIYIYNTDTSVRLRNNLCRKNGKRGICFNDTNRGVAEGNICQENGNDKNSIGISVSGKDGSVTLKENTCSKQKKNGIFIYGGCHVILENNTLEKNGNTGIVVYDKGTHVTIRGNTLCGNQSYGIYIGRGAQGLIENNHIEHSGSGISLDNAGDSIVVRRNYCRSNKYGIKVFKTARATVNENICEENKRSGILLYKTKKENTVSKNLCWKNGNHGIYLNLTSDAVIEDNVCLKNNSSGIGVFDSKDNILIKNNYCRDNDSSGIKLKKTNIVFVEGNISEQNGDSGICFRQSYAEVHIKSNVAVKNHIYGICFQEGAKGLVENNLCEDNSYEGIIVRTGKDTSVHLRNNCCRRNHGSGILLEQGACGKVEGNICENNPWSGIAVRGRGTNPLLSQNHCNNNGAWGIICWAGAQPVIEDNNTTEDNGKEGVKRRD